MPAAWRSSVAGACLPASERISSTGSGSGSGTSMPVRRTNASTACLKFSDAWSALSRFSCKSGASTMRWPSTPTRRPNNVTPFRANWCRLMVCPPYFPESCGLGANLALGEGSWSAVCSSLPRVTAQKKESFPPIPARPPYGTAHAHIHATPALIELLGDLAAGIGAADHQHRPGWQGMGVAVVTGVQLDDLRGQGATERRRLGELKRARGDDDRGRRVGGTVRSGHTVALAVLRRVDGRDLHPAAHRSLEAGGVPLQV